MWDDLIAFADIGDSNFLALDIGMNAPIYGSVRTVYGDLKASRFRQEGLIARSFDDWLSRTITYAREAKAAFAYWLAADFTEPRWQQPFL